MDRELLESDRSFVAGIFLNYSNSVMLSLTWSQFFSAFSGSKGRPLRYSDGWPTLTLHHEGNHFLMSITSPILKFIDDVILDAANDFGILLTKHLPRLRVRRLDQPLLRLHGGDRELMFLTNCIATARHVIDSTINVPVPQLKDFDGYMNQIIMGLNLSRGETDPTRSGWVLPESPAIDDPLRSVTTRGILEGLARWTEFDILLLEGDHSVAFNEWQSICTGIYAQVLDPLTKLFPDMEDHYLRGMIMALSLRAGFFPMSDFRQRRIADFHPVCLLAGLVEFARQNYDRFTMFARGTGRDEPDIAAAKARIFATEAASTFGLVTDARPFVTDFELVHEQKARTDLDTKAPGYVAFLNRGRELHALREEYFSYWSARDFARCREGTMPERIYLEDCIIDSRSNVQKSVRYTIDEVRFRQFATGWWITFGDDSFLRMWERIDAIPAQDTSFQGLCREPKSETRHEFAARVYKLDIRFY